MPDKEAWPSQRRKCLVHIEGTEWVCARCGGRYATLSGGQATECVVEATPSGRPPAALETADREAEVAVPVGKVSRLPEGDGVRLELTPSEVRDLANRIVDAMATRGDLEPTAQTWISMLFLATAYLRHLGVPHTEVMQLVTVAWNGRETGIFFVGEEGAAGGTDAAAGTGTRE